MSDELNVLSFIFSPLGPVSRVLILDYYDGALNGVLEAEPGDVYRFDSADEESCLPDLTQRTFTLRVLPRDSLERLVSAFAPFAQPSWPAWMPVWNFPDESTESAIETEVQGILDVAGPIVLTLSTDDYFRFSHFQTIPARSAQEVLK